ncbi:MAG: aldo/keto reductase family protein [Fimbriimonadaceae bacterium]|nr:aldo/keto reductase family protein [Fimbriimonadaceae bacterium]QYK57026.1 MAG: aldo/keto reductase family protein [Fimbriimonadaceae bacterium]
MHYRRLGRSGVRVSEVALGGWLTQGRTLDSSATAAIVRHAFELGVNFFDTADVYNLGEAEKALGHAVKDLRRRNLFIATKCYFPMSEAPNDRGLSRKHIVESCNDSLKRLGLDYIDLYQFHRHDPESPIEEVVRAVDDLVRQGKVLYWGVSMWPAGAIVDACRVAESWRCTLPVSNQPVYNLLQREIESAVISASEQAGVGQVVFSPLAQGILTGKYRPGQPPPAGSRGADDSSNQFMSRFLEDAELERIQALGPIIEEAGCTWAQFALAWCLRQQNVSSVIVGASRPEQLDDNVAASGLAIDPELFKRAEACVA